MAHHVDIRKKLSDLHAQEAGPFRFRENGPFRVCLVYPNTYAVGMSNLGLQVNYRAINGVKGVTCERAFLPDSDWDKAMKGKAPVLSLETQRPLSDFHVIAFSVTYELDYLNMVRILERAGIPALKEERGEGHPLIVAGGAAVTANPDAMADLVDVFWIGESEADVADVFGAMAEGWGGPNLLADLCRFPHVHVPGVNPYWQVYTSIKQFELDDHPATSQCITPNTVFSSTGLIEITRGCKWPCRFCIARTLYGPVRKLSRPVIERYAQEIKPFTNKLGLFGAGISDYEGLEDLIGGLANDGFTVGVSSLRIAAMTPQLLDALYRAGQKTVTVAPESFSQRILKRMAKGVNHVLLHRGMEELTRSTMARVKCYLMLGIPGEDESDLALVREIVEPYAKRSTCNWEISFSILEPKPHTPFESFHMATRAEVEDRIRYLRRMMAGVPRCSLNLPSFNDTFLCDWLGRGDRRVGREIVRQMRESGTERFRLNYREYLDYMQDLLKERRVPWALNAEGIVSPPPFEPMLPIVEAARMPGAAAVTQLTATGTEVPAM
jgi:radical SAM superfamily enzyme YgiQ (UPF0313 family)